MDDSLDIREGLKSLRESIRRLTRTPRILVIEDSNTDLETLTNHLKKLGGECDISEARTGDQGVTQLASHDYDIVFLDLTLPGMSGVDVMHQMSDSERKKTVIVTGLFEDAGEIKEAICLGAVKVLTKPVKQDDIKAIFQRL